MTYYYCSVLFPFHDISFETNVAVVSKSRVPPTFTLFEGPHQTRTVLLAFQFCYYYTCFVVEILASLGCCNLTVSL